MAEEAIAMIIGLLVLGVVVYLIYLFYKWLSGYEMMSMYAQGQEQKYHSY